MATLLQQWVTPEVTREKSCPSKHFGQESILKAKRNENRIKWTSSFFLKILMTIFKDNELHQINMPAH